MDPIDFRKALPLYGIWAPSDDGDKTTFSVAQGEDASHGLLLMDKKLDDGLLEATLSIESPSRQCGAFIVFRSKGQEQYYAAGIGGWDHAYTLAEGRHLSLTRLSGAGTTSNVVPGRPYRIQLILEGQRVQVLVDGIRVIDYDRLTTIDGSGLGLFSFKGSGTVAYGPVMTKSSKPNAFVAMQFSEPYNAVYSDAIRPLIEEIGYDCVRVDEIARPGLILDDIRHQLTEATVVIAETSEPNPNVYYEVGLAQGLGKPTILLAQRGTKLPFDLAQHRCIFYENTIPGRSRLLDALRASLTTVLGIVSTPS